MTDPIAQASSAALQSFKSRVQVLQRMTEEVSSKNDQRVASIIQNPPAGEKIIMEGLSSRGGRIDISV
ncbi:MAG: hypothetical protein RLY86_1261 [Pseudomonadota bacterium]|jgi:hypothetical protein